MCTVLPVDLTWAKPGGSPLLFLTSLGVQGEADALSWAFLIYGTNEDSIMWFLPCFIQEKQPFSLQKQHFSGFSLMCGDRKMDLKEKKRTKSLFSSGHGSGWNLLFIWFNAWFSEERILRFKYKSSFLCQNESGSLKTVVNDHWMCMYSLNSNQEIDNEQQFYVTIELLFLSWKYLEMNLCQTQPARDTGFFITAPAW